VYNLKGTGEVTNTLLVPLTKGRGGRALELPDLNKNIVEVFIFGNELFP
jgi:hypothetical protein